jgi:hypothetical protein
MMTDAQPGEPVNIQDVTTTPPTEPMFPLLANLIPNAKLRLTLYSLWSLFSLIYLAAIMPNVDGPEPELLTITIASGNILFGAVAGANVPRRTQ